MIGFFAGNLGDWDNFTDGRCLFCKRHGICTVITSHNKRSPHRTVHPGLDGQRTGIDTGHPKEVIFFKKGSDGRLMFRFLADLFCDTPESTNVRVLEILGVDTIVANLGKGEHQDLPEITRIGKRFHVTGHLGIKDQFSCTFAFHPESFTDNKVPVFESQNRLHDVHTLCAGLVINADAKDRTNPLVDTHLTPLSTEDPSAMCERTYPTNNPKPPLRYTAGQGMAQSQIFTSEICWPVSPLLYSTGLNFLLLKVFYNANARERKKQGSSHAVRALDLPVVP